MILSDTYYGMIPVGSHSGMFGVQCHIAAGNGKGDERGRVFEALRTYMLKQQNMLYATLDYVTPPPETEFMQFVDDLRMEFPNLYLVVKSKFAKIPLWYPHANWIIQEINLVDWKGLPCNEVHATLRNPMADPVVMVTNQSLWLIKGERTDPQVMFDFVRKSSNPWRFGVESKPVKVRITS